MKRKGGNSCEIEARLAGEPSAENKSISPVLREGLRLSIINRRLANGQEDICVEFKEPEKHELTPLEIEKKRRRREQNRRAARRCREKKKRHQEGTFMGLAQIMEENKNLEAEINLLKSQKNAIQRFLDAHKSCLKIKEEEGECPPSPQSACNTTTSSAEMDILESLAYSCQMTSCNVQERQNVGDTLPGDSLPQSVVEFCLEHSESSAENSLFLDCGDDMRRQTVSVSSASSDADHLGMDSDTDTVQTWERSALSECSEDEDVFQSNVSLDLIRTPSDLANDVFSESYLPLGYIPNVPEGGNLCNSSLLMQYLSFSEP